MIIFNDKKPFLKAVIEDFFLFSFLALMAIFFLAEPMRNPNLVEFHLTFFNLDSRIIKIRENIIIFLKQNQINQNKNFIEFGFEQNLNFCIFCYIINP